MIEAPETQGDAVTFAGLLEAIAGDCDSGEDNDWEAHEWAAVAADIRKAATLMQSQAALIATLTAERDAARAQGIEEAYFIAWKRAEDLSCAPRCEYADHQQFENGRAIEARLIATAIRNLNKGNHHDPTRQ